MEKASPPDIFHDSSQLEGLSCFRYFSSLADVLRLVSPRALLLLTNEFRENLINSSLDNKTT